MRKLMWFTLGFGAGCGICAYGLKMAWILPACFITAGIFLISLLFRKMRRMASASLALLGVLFSLGWFALFYQLYLEDAVAVDSCVETVSVTATDYSYERNYGIAFDGKLDWQGRSYRVRTYLNEPGNLNPGDKIQGSFRFRVTTGDGEEDATNHPGKGIFLLAYQQGDVEIQKESAISLETKIAVFRQKIRDILVEFFPEDTSAFAQALLLGDTGGISYETDTDLKVSGIRHVAAVSGLHISILFALLSTVTFRKRFLRLILGIPVLALFASIAGFTPSVVRACVMCALMLLADLCRREYDGPTSLSFAVLCMLLQNPLVVTSVSLQLSVASVAGIFCFREPIVNWIDSFFDRQKGRSARLLHRLAISVAISLSAMVFTTPLCAYYFGMVSLIGPVTNLLALWVISGVFYGIMGVCALSCFWYAGAGLLAKLIAWPIRYVLLVAKTMADFPLAAVYTSNFYIVLWLIFVYILLVVFLLQKRKTPSVLGCCMALGLCAALLAGWMEQTRDDVRLTVLDVGQGQAILLQTEGRNFLVDCGGDSDTATADIVAGTLLSQGIIQLDAVILTHYDRDHAGALEHLLTRIPSDVLLLPETENKRPFGPALQEIRYVEDVVEISLDQGKLTVFGPVYSGSGNENSMCILFERETCAILVTGDRAAFGERMLMRKTKLPDVDVLIAGHHGSKHSTSEELLQAVSPETVIISAGENNSYGHPAPELLQRLQKFGCTVYRTDLHGTIIYRR